MREILIYAACVAAALLGIPLVGILVIKWTAFLITYLGVFSP